MSASVVEPKMLELDLNATSEIESSLNRQESRRVLRMIQERLDDDETERTWTAIRTTNRRRNRYAAARTNHRYCAHPGVSHYRVHALGLGPTGFCGRARRRRRGGAALVV